MSKHSWSFAYLVAAAVSCFACAANAQTANVTPIYSFAGPADGVSPQAGLVQGSDGNFYGTAPVGGSYNCGTVFKITPAGILTTLYTFTGGADGYDPQAGLTQGSDGNFYGTTSASGQGAGTVFKITPAGTLTTLYSFGAAAAAGHPNSRLIQGAGGNFYGVGPGSVSLGAVYKVTPAGVLTTLYTFTGGADGAIPFGLTLGKDGNFYGTTNEGGGAGSDGTVFKITPAGVLTTLHSFAGSGEHGGGPSAGLTQGSDGNFYGTTLNSESGYATVFKMTPSGTLTTLNSFFGDCTADLVQGADGDFYGTIDNGGSPGLGTVFKITPAGILTTLYTFSGAADGAFPQGGLTPGNDGNFYGATQGGGDSANDGDGVIFKITPAGAFSTIYVLTHGADGTVPYAGLTLGSDGDFYGGTAFGGDRNGDGTIFKITSDGLLTNLYTFSGGANGSNPETGLTLGSDGDFYGATAGGGVGLGYGTIFKMTPAGVLTMLYAFTGGADGQAPGRLTQGRDGNFYGTTSSGGDSNGDGTVFKITPAGVLTTIYTFTFGADGRDPYSGLALGNDGNFYGTTYGDPLDGVHGTVFKITPAGVLTTLYSFTGGADGASPQALLTLGSDGNFYGTTGEGGDSNGDGTVFKITPAGILTTLYRFTGGAGGAIPAASLTQASNGNLYGTTSGGEGYSGNGTVFEITPAGNLTTLYAFTGGADGASPLAGLTLGRDGCFYSTASGGGQNGFGDVFRLTVSPPAVTSGTASAQVGSAFSFQIVASNRPASFGASNLAPGLIVDTAAGIISGTPTQSGTFTVGITATNSLGTGAGTLTLTVSPAPPPAPVLSSALSAGGRAGQAFTYQITASNAPTSFGASGLPAGLSVDTSTGIISGTPTASGTFSVSLSATNSGGTGAAVLTITLAPALPVVTLTPTAPQVVVGSGDAGEFTITLSAPQSADLAVDFAIKGTAINGVDYQLIKASKKIKAGKTSKVIKIIPQGDLGGASRKVVTLVLTPEAAYTVGTTGKVKVKILAAPGQ